MYNKLKNIIPHKVKIDGIEARLLEQAQDENILQNFLKSNEDYYLTISNSGATDFEARLLFEVVPLNKTLNDKFIVGFFKENNLIAIIDLIQNYEADNEWTIGEFIVDLSHRNKGIGKQILENIENLLLSLKVNSIRLAANYKNSKAINFWHKNGYRDFGKTAEQDIVMVKKLEKKEFSILDKCFKNNRLVFIPSKPEERKEVYKKIQSWFEKGKKYTELEINTILKNNIETSDHASLRRDMVDNGYLNRSDNGKEYWI